MLEIGKTRFFALLKAYRRDPETFSLAYQRTTKGRLSDQAEAEIQQGLLREKALIEDKDLPSMTTTIPPWPTGSRRRACRYRPRQSPSERRR